MSLIHIFGLNTSGIAGLLSYETYQLRSLSCTKNPTLVAPSFQWARASASAQIPVILMHVDSQFHCWYSHLKQLSALCRLSWGHCKLHTSWVASTRCSNPNIFLILYVHPLVLSNLCSNATQPPQVWQRVASISSAVWDGRASMFATRLLESTQTRYSSYTSMFNQSGFWQNAKNIRFFKTNLKSSCQVYRTPHLDAIPKVRQLRKGLRQGKFIFSGWWAFHTFPYLC